MKLLLPLGLLGLATILILILIYILKPNYQQKVISSTFVWKLSLKYRKKRLPISKLRNVLLLICQILILVFCSLLLAQPYLSQDDAALRQEKIVIIDASASMQCKHDGTTRFERAINAVDEVSRKTIGDGSRVTLIYADDSPEILFNRADSSELISLRTKLNELKCTDGKSDLDAAVRLSESILDINPYAEVLLYTGTKYLHSELVNVQDMSVDGEYNAAVLDVVTHNDENTFVFDVTVASFGKGSTVTLDLEVSGANRSLDDNGEGTTVYFRREVTQLRDGEKRVITIDTREEDEPVYSFDSVYAHIDGGDDLSLDDRYYLYGGEKPVIKVLYASNDPGVFFPAAMLATKKIVKNDWNLEFTELDLRLLTDDTPVESYTSGYDFYIFEHQMPSVIPTDGVVLLVDPDIVPDGLNMRLGESVDGTFALALGRPHDITASIDPTRINITRYTRIQQMGGYQEIMFCGGDPVLFVKNESNAKVAVLAFSINMSTFSMLPDFSWMMLSFFRYYFPPTITSNVFEVGDTVVINARSDALDVTAPNGEFTYEDFPVSIDVCRGQYTLTQRLLSGQPQIDNFFVKIPSIESDIARVEDELATPFVRNEQMLQDVDLTMWFALAVIVLLMAEWLLYSYNPS